MSALAKWYASKAGSCADDVAAAESRMSSGVPVLQHNVLACFGLRGTQYQLYSFDRGVAGVEGSSNDGWAEVGKWV